MSKTLFFLLLSRHSCLYVKLKCTFEKCTKPLHRVLQVSTHNMHSSSEDDDMESPFPNDLSLQQVGTNDIDAACRELNVYLEESLESFMISPYPPRPSPTIRSNR